MREPTKITKTRRGNAGGLYVKESTMPKTQAMKEDVWMSFTKSKTRKTSYAPLTKK